MKNRIKVTTNPDLSYYNLEGSLVDCIKTLTDELNLIPEEHRADSHISIDLSDSYGSPTCEIEIYYWRDETDSEYKERLNIIEIKKQNVKNRKMQDYLKLKNELGL